MTHRHLGIPYYAPAGGAVRFDAVGDKYSRSASGLAGTFTWTCWVKPVVDRNTYTSFIAQDNAGANYYFIGTLSDGTTISRDATSAAGVSSGVSMTLGTWYYVACVNDTAGGGTDIFGWKPAGGSWATALLGSGVTATGPSDSNTFYIGNSGFSDWFNGSIAAVKIWTVALTEAELQAEAATYAPVKTSGLWANYKFNAGPQTTDDSGNGKTLTAGGTLTLDSSGPPIT